MKKKLLIAIVISSIIIAAVALTFYASLTGFSVFASKQTTGRSWEPMIITQANVATVLTQTNIVRDIPEGGIIEAYVGENVYTIQRGSMTRGAPSNPDVTVRMPERYLEIMGQRGPCAAFATARGNGELTVEMHQSSTSLAWKYRSLAKYKSCLG